MKRVAAIFDSIPDSDWLDLGYMLLFPSVTVVALPLFILWFRP